MSALRELGLMFDSKEWSDPSSLPRNPNPDSDDALAILLPLLILLTTLLFLLLLFLLFLLLIRRNRSIHLPSQSGPTNLHDEQDLDSASGGIPGVEQRWLEQADEPSKISYMRAKAWQSQYLPNSQPTDITLSQFLSIQEKGVSAWSFEPDYESNAAIFVESRTEITFLADGLGMAPAEGGGCTVLSNLPLPKVNDVYYFECKMFDKPENTAIAIGLATKPYPTFRLPGLAKYSVAYSAIDGFKSHSYPFTAQSYGPALQQGDVLGVGYRPRSGTVFFTRNGKKLEDAFVGLNRYNLFPAIGANGACTVHVNLGQAGFVFIEANVKKWGLAPMVGTLAPPPAYGSEGGSILLESASGGISSQELRAAMTNLGGRRERRRRSRRRSHLAPDSQAEPTPSSSFRPSPLRHAREDSSDSSDSQPGTSNQRYAEMDTSLPTSVPLAGQSRVGDSDSDADSLINPPTPGSFDMSLQSINRRPQETTSEEEGSHSSSDEQPAQRDAGTAPPAYYPVDPNRYPAGVAEALLSDIFSTPSARAHAHNYAEAGLAELAAFTGIGSSWPGPTGSGRTRSSGSSRNRESTGGVRNWWSWFQGSDTSSSPV